MVRPATALAVGVAVGAAAGRRRQQQQQPQTVYVAQPTTTTTTVYSDGVTYQTAQVVQVPQAVVVTQQKPARKRNVVVLCTCVLFTVTIVLCGTLIPWPGWYYRSVTTGMQTLDYFGTPGFISGVEFVPRSDAQLPTIYSLPSRPPLTATRTFSYNIGLTPSYGIDDYARVELFYESSVTVMTSLNIPAGYSCSIELWVIRSQYRFDNYRAYGNLNYYGEKLATYYNGTSTGSWTLYATDDYYFLYNYANANCPQGTTGAAELRVNARSYDTSDATDVCNSLDCFKSLARNYSSYYLVIEAPVTGAPISSAIVYAGDFRTYGYAWSYVGLYAGLGVGLCLCMALAARLSKRGEHDGGDHEAQNADDNAPLLRQQPVYAYGGAPTYAVQAGDQGGAASAAPPPYQYPAQVKYDPTTGAPI